MLNSLFFFNHQHTHIILLDIVRHKNTNRYDERSEHFELDIILTIEVFTRIVVILVATTHNATFCIWLKVNCHKKGWYLKHHSKSETDKVYGIN